MSVNNYFANRLFAIITFVKRIISEERDYRIVGSDTSGGYEVEITAKVTSEDYDFDKAPIEFNTWLVFRRLVDLILMCDFVSYSLFAFSCYSLPEGENSVLTMARWVGGLILIVFNLWVKLDAHRVVKDYAWCSSSPGSRTIFSGC